MVHNDTNFSQRHLLFIDRSRNAIHLCIGIRLAMDILSEFPNKHFCKVWQSNECKPIPVWPLCDPQKGTFINCCRVEVRAEFDCSIRWILRRVRSKI